MDVTFIMFFVGETLHIHQSKSESKLSLRKDNAFLYLRVLKLTLKNVCDMFFVRIIMKVYRNEC